MAITRGRIYRICAVLSVMVTLEAWATESRAITVVGYLEAAVVLPAGLPMTAKMDTGAETSSIHALDIQLYTVDGESWVRFTVNVGDREEVFRSRVQRIVRIRRAGVTVIERPVVHLGICIAGYYKNAEVNLTDRTGMNQQLLIGRKFMASGELVIDSGATFAAKPDCAGAPRNVERP